jgi:outer membrane protein OmpA-like peptidoglycan-associated protein
MNKALRLGVLAVCGASLIACAGIHTSEAPARPVSRDYAVAPGDTSGVTAYVYGKHTVLEFKAVPVFLSIKDGQGASVDYEREGQYVRLNRQLDTFTASMNGRSVTFMALQPVQAAAPVAEQPALPVKLVEAVPQNPTVDLTAALDKMQQQIREIKKSLAASKGKPASTKELQRLNARLDRIEAQVNASQTVVLQVTFPSHGVAFKPSEDIAKALIPAAKAASQINLRGRTDAKIAGLEDASIALDRALSARKYLIDHGITADKISVSSQAEGDFIAPSWTKEGKAKNRRVEIELVAAPLRIASK